MTDLDTAAALHIAFLDTRNHDFIAGGQSAEHARATLRRAWNLHAKQTRATLTWNDLADGVHMVTLRAGEALRDGEPLLAIRACRHQ